MAKIQITESEIQGMVKRGVMKLLEMRTEHADRSYSGSINAVDYLAMEKDLGEQSEISALLQSAELPNLIPFDMYFPGGVSGAGPDDNWGDIQHGNKEELESILQKAMLAKQNNPAREDLFDAYTMLVYAILEATDIDEFEYEYGSYVENEQSADNPYEPDPDMQPGGHDYLEEGLMEHDPDDRDFGQVEDWKQEQAIKAVSRGRNFRSKEDFEGLVSRLDLPLQSAQVYLTHGDIGLLDKQVMVEYWPESIYYESPDPEVGISFGGWVVEDIDWEYGPEETCSFEGKIQPMKRGMIGWLDDAIEKYNEEKFDAIVELLYT